MKSLLERFGIQVPEDFDDCNLIGLDFGDGEVSAAIPRWNESDKQLEVLTIPLHDNGLLMKNPNAYYISETKQELINDTNKAQDEKGERYYNFKKYPGGSDAKSKYIFDDGTESSKTREEVMATCFGILVEILFKCNGKDKKGSGILDISKPTVILVGRPSNPVWAAHEVEYARLLESGIKNHRDRSIRVAVQAESSAALAREINPIWGDARVKRGEVVVILDNGSSTFDITVVTRNGVPEGGEDSYQFGGNEIDKNLLSLLKIRAAEEHPGDALITLDGSMLMLRMKKEAFYGVNGTSEDSQTYKRTLVSGQKFKFEIDEDTMDYVLTKMPVRAAHLEFRRGLPFPIPVKGAATWMSACSKIYDAYYAEMKKFFTRKNPNTEDKEHDMIPDRVILSGGVSVMPEVQKVVEQTFGVKPTVTDRVNYSVSEGLAYVLGNEVRKAQYLKRLKKEIRDILPNSGSLRESILSAGEDEKWNMFKDSIRLWAKEPQPRSIRQWYEYYFYPIFLGKLSKVGDLSQKPDVTSYGDLGKTVKVGAQNWYEKGNGSGLSVNDLITEKLKKHFETMFPGYVDEFHYSFSAPNFDALQGITVTIFVDWSFFFGKGMEPAFNTVGVTEEEYEKTRNQQWRQHAYQEFLSLENKVRKGGTISLPYLAKEKTGWLSKNEVTVTKYKDYEYKGIRSCYVEKLDGTCAANIRNEILALLDEPLKEYVEMITPYFNMTSRR